MVTTPTLNIDGILFQAEAELEEFEDCFKEGILYVYLGDVWIVNENDWLMLLVNGIESLYGHINELDDTQKNKLRGVVIRIKKIKAEILKQKYEYPIIIDQVEI